MRVGKREIKNGQKFERYFTARPKGDFVLIKTDAKTMDDTIPLIKKVIADTLLDTVEIANHLQGDNVKDTCKRVWDFCFSHFQYTKDEKWKEQIRRPSRAWRDRKQGIDCDCFTVFIGSILTNLGIPYVMRLTRYQSVEFEHIYPVAKTNEGEIIIDCVVHEFNKEANYRSKQDEDMDLEYLNGVTGERFNEFGDKVHFENDLPIDAEALFLDGMELDGLEGKAERLARKAKRKEKKTVRKATPLKERLKKGINKINKFNPVTALLRAGILASLKLNVFKIASILRFAYWTDSEARKNQMDMSKFNQLKRIREKLEKIYFGAGGQKSALKKAMLTGRGNQNRMVQLNGLGAIITPVYDEDDLQTILGEDLFFEELNGLDGLGSLGVIATGTAVAAASGVMGTIAAMLKKIGNLFKKGSRASENFKIQDNGDNANEKTRRFSLKNLASKFKQRREERKSKKLMEQGKSPTEETGLTPMDTLPEDEFVLDDNIINNRSMETDTGGDDDSDDKTNEKGIIAWIKNNPIPTALIGVGVAGGTYLAIKAVKGKSKKGLSGAPKKRGKTKAKATTKKSTAKKSVTKKSTTTKKKSTSKQKPKPKNGTVQKMELYD